MTASVVARKTTGAGAAAVVAAGIGTFTIGLMTSLAEASAGLRTALIWYAPSGPLSGKAGVGVLAWLIAWIALHSAWQGRNVDFRRSLTWAFVLLAVGFLLTFPPVFEAFAP